MVQLVNKKEKKSQQLEKKAQNLSIVAEITNDVQIVSLEEDIMMPESGTWEQTVKEVACQAALADDRTRMGWADNDERMPPFAYRWEHVQQVVRCGRWLLSQVEADADIVIAACWLHDVEKRLPNHEQGGAEFARQFLPTTDFPTAKIEAVAKAIELHKGLWRPAKEWRKTEPFRPALPLQPIEVALLWDADKLSKIGPTAFLQSHPAYLFEIQQKGQSTTTQQLISRNRRWVEITVPRIIGSFNTQAAQRKAMELYPALQLFWQTAKKGLFAFQAQPKN
jgi:uncharacterized protein